MERFERVPGTAPRRKPDRKPEKHTRYDFATKVRAVEDHAVRGMSAAKAMFRNGVVSAAAYYRWLACWREGGRAALLPKPLGRPPASMAKREAKRAMAVREAMESLR